MPYKSDAQRKYFHAALDRGEIKPSTVEEFDKASKGMKLPNKVKQHYEGGQVKTKDEKDKDHYKKLKEMMGFKS